MEKRTSIFKNLFQKNKQKNIEPGTMTDIDGNVYKTVKIGKQLWMAENLKVTRYRNGDAIPEVTDDLKWINLTNGAYCHYNNNSNNTVNYGALYNWFAVNDSRKIAPKGWHVPSDAEWQRLVNFLGGEDVAGAKLKETGTTHWESPNEGATNESGFSARSGGSRGSGFGSNSTYGNFGSFNDRGDIDGFWSSTKNVNDTAWIRTFLGNDNDFCREFGFMSFGFSVRLVRD
ncbi:fibrobacter succinogenes major paralogous domain-containing protein [candidate division KSB1 bacterium]|nr:fibrobacter succinogenes major paralogous domain-containing protein [candidate division KSB1 bacterium]